MSPSPLQEQIRRRSEAAKAFTRAAASALDAVDTAGDADALLFGAIGVMHIVQSDPEGKVLQVLVAALEAVRDGKLRSR